VAKHPIPPGYAKLDVVGFDGPATWTNVLYFDCSPSDPDVPGDVAVAVANAAHALYAGLPLADIQSAVQITGWKVVYRADPTSTYSFTVADAIVGANTGEGQDAQVAYLLNWVSGDARKGGKPRSYIPGVSNNARADTARLTSGVLSAFDAAIATWLASFPFTHGTATVTNFVEMSFVSAGVDLNPPIARPIVGGHLNPIVGTQRRRVDRLRG